MGNRKRARIVGVAALAWILGVAGVAFACTPITSMRVTPAGVAATAGADKTDSKASAKPGETVTVTVLNGADAFSGGAEVRWNSMNGPLLATVNQRNFSVPVEVPTQARPGVYYLVVAAPEPSGGVVGKAVTTLMVTSSDEPAAAPAQSPWDSPSATPTAADTISTKFALGLALLSVGLVILFAGVTVNVVGRRRAPVETSSRR